MCPVQSHGDVRPEQMLQVGDVLQDRRRFLLLPEGPGLLWTKMLPRGPALLLPGQPLLLEQDDVLRRQRVLQDERAVQARHAVRPDPIMTQAAAS